MTDIRIMKADGMGDHAVLANTVFSVEPRWSAKNQLVMNGSGLEIYAVNADGTNLQQLTSGAYNNGDPSGHPMVPALHLVPSAKVETSSTSS
jgi:hypothetical protein